MSNTKAFPQDNGTVLHLRRTQGAKGDWFGYCYSRKGLKLSNYIRIKESEYEKMMKDNEK